MIDDDPDTVHRHDLASTADEGDPFATRVPRADDPLLTRAEAEAASTTLPDPVVNGSTSGRRSPDGPRFRIIRGHARGGIGEVFLALDAELRREVALKEIQDRHADDPRSRARFLLEAEVTGSLEHPGIVPVYGLGHYPDGRPYYAMRFIRGDSLKQALDRHHKTEGSGPRPDPALQSLELRKHLGKFVDICNAMAYAHSRGVLHRDLKPDNVMLGPYGEVLVVDWGLAKWLARPEADDSGVDPSGSGSESTQSGSCETVAGSVVGTPAFMSPEQAAGELDRLGPASDIYSLGGTLYYVLTGRTPFKGLDVREVLARVREGKFPTPRSVRRDVPRPLEAICLKAMATRPEDRYPTARALANDVENWLAGAPVSAHPDSIAVRLWRWCRGRPVLTTTALACAFLDLCGVVVLLLAYIQSVLHASSGSMPRLNTAAGVLVLIPFAIQAGALIGAAVGAIIGSVRRKSWTGFYRGANIGLKFGVPSAIVIYLTLGAFEVARPPSWVPVASQARPAVPPLAWPKLPGAVAERPSWIKPSAPVDVASFFDEPPRDQNAATLYLDAFLEFDDGMASCFSPDEGARRAAIARRRKERIEQFDRAWRLDPSSVDRAALDALLEDCEVGFLKLKQAQRRPRCVFRTGLGLETLLPHVEAAREVARAWVLRAHRRLEQGEVDRAIDDFEASLRLARDLQPRGHLTTQLAGISIESLAEHDILPPILREPGLRVEQADRLLTILRGHSSAAHDPFVEGYRAEYVGIGQTIHAYVDRLVREEKLGGSRARNVLRSLLTSSPALPIESIPEALKFYEELEVAVDAQLSKTTPRDFAESSYRSYDEFHRAILGLVKLPLLERIEAIRQLPPKMLAGRHPLLLFLSPDGASFLKASGRAEALRGIMKCLVALRRWELAGRGEPTDLEAVVKAAGMEKVPVDPFRREGGPLRMVVVEGAPVVYSIGLDGIDDGGILDAKLGNEPRGDYLFRLK